MRTVSVPEGWFPDQGAAFALNPLRSGRGSRATACRREIRFLLSVETSSIYKKNGSTQKVRNIVCPPSFDAVDELNRRLGAIGNLKSDGRPVLGLDSRDQLEISPSRHSSSMSESSGRANAAVLPVPVWAWPTTSCPFCTNGITAS